MYFVNVEEQNKVIDNITIFRDLFLTQIRSNLEAFTLIDFSEKVILTKQDLEIVFVTANLPKLLIKCKDHFDTMELNVLQNSGIVILKTYIYPDNHLEELKECMEGLEDAIRLQIEVEELILMSKNLDIIRLYKMLRHYKKEHGFKIWQAISTTQEREAIQYWHKSTYFSYLKELRLDIKDFDETYDDYKNALCFQIFQSTLISKVIRGNKATMAVEKEYEDYAEYIYDNLVTNQTSTKTRNRIKLYLMNSIKYIFTTEKTTTHIYNILFNFKVFGKMLEIAKIRINKKKNSVYVKLVKNNLLSIFNTDDNIHLIFKLL